MRRSGRRKGSLEMAAVTSADRCAMDSHNEGQKDAKEDPLKKLYPAVNEAKTPLPRAWSPKEKYNLIGLSQNNLRVHYKGEWVCMCVNVCGRCMIFKVFLWGDCDLPPSVCLMRAPVCDVIDRGGRANDANEQRVISWSWHIQQTMGCCSCVVVVIVRVNELFYFFSIYDVMVILVGGFLEIFAKLRSCSISGYYLY